MKKIILKSLLVCSLFATSSHAYMASNVKVNVIGYKTKAKVGVNASFDKFDFSVKENKSFTKLMESASIVIDVYSLNSKMKFRDNNITSTLFKLTNIKNIKASIKKVNGNEDKGIFDVNISMNKINKIIKMPYEIKDGILQAKGNVDLLDFALNDSFAAFAQKCKAFHAGKTFSDVTISFVLELKK